MAIGDHPDAKKLPEATTDPTIQSGPQDFRAFAARGDAPATLEEFIHSDSPMLSLHITSFTDATLVALSWPHALMDVMGQKALLHAWSLVLAGRESEVPKVLGANEDAVVAAAEAPSGPIEFKLGARRLATISMIWFGARFGWDLLTSKSVETRTICMPKRFVEEMRQQAMAELTAEHGAEKDVFISEGDALTAWALRSVALSSPQPRPVTALHALNLRFRLPALINAGGVYIRNMAIAAFTFVPAETATGGSLGAIALENRRCLSEQATEPQVLAFLRELCADPALVVNPVVFCGDPNTILVPFTNWTKAEFTKVVDFGPAVVSGTGTDEDEDENRSTRPGSLTFHHAQSLREHPASRNVFVIMGKDQGENYWVTATLHPPTWDVIEKSLANS